MGPFRILAGSVLWARIQNMVYTWYVLGSTFRARTRGQQGNLWNEGRTSPTAAEAAAMSGLCLAMVTSTKKPRKKKTVSVSARCGAEEPPRRRGWTRMIPLAASGCGRTAHRLETSAVGRGAAGRPRPLTQTKTDPAKCHEHSGCSSAYAFANSSAGCYHACAEDIPGACGWHTFSRPA